MLNRDYRDILGGGLLLLTGLFVAWHGWRTLELGSLQRMGSGFFPCSVGLILAGFGLAILIPATLRGGTFAEIEWRAAGAILAGVAFFALVTPFVGLAPAIVGLVVISSLTETIVRPVSIVVLCIVLLAAVYLTFVVGLGLPLPLIRWAF